MVPFENLVGAAMAAKGLMAEIQILRKKMSPLQSLLTCLSIFSQRNYFGRYLGWLLFIEKPCIAGISVLTYRF